MPGLTRGVVANAVAVVVAGVLVALSALSPFPGAVAAAAVAAVVLLGIVVLRPERAGYVALGLGMATAPMYRGIMGTSDGIGTPTDFFLVAGIFLLLPTALKRKLRLPPLYLASLAVVIAFGLVGNLASDTPIFSAFFFLQWLFYLAVLPSFVAWLRPSTSVVVRLLWAYLAGHLISTGYAVVEGPAVGERYDGLAHHVNAFGIAGLVSVAMVLYLFWHHRDDRVRLFLVFIGIVAFVSITMSGSRSALAVAVVLILMVPLVERSAIWGFMYAIGIALVAFMLPLIIDVSRDESALARLVGGGTADFSDQRRESALSSGFDQFAQSPLIGDGFVGIELIHSVYLEVAVAAGLVGALAYFAVLYTLARPLFGSHPDRRLCYLAWAFVGIAPAIPGLWDRTIWVPLALAILPALGSAADEKETSASEPRDVTAVSAGSVDESRQLS